MCLSVCARCSNFDVICTYMGFVLVKRLHYPNRNRKINSSTYPFPNIQIFRFRSFVFGMCVCLFFFSGVLVCTSCYLICVVYYFARYITCILQIQWPRSCCDSLQTVNAFAVFLILSIQTNSCTPIQTLTSSFWKTSHLILWFISFGFICDFTVEPNVGKPNKTQKYYNTTYRFR